MLEEINKELAKEQIPAVDMIVLKWRMSQLLRDIQRKYSTAQVSVLCMCTPAYVP